MRKLHWAQGICPDRGEASDCDVKARVADASGVTTVAVGASSGDSIEEDGAGAVETGA